MSCRVSLPKGCHLNDHWSSSPTALAFPIPKRWPKLVCEWWNHHPPIRRLGMHPTMFFGFVGGIPTPLKNMKVRWDDYSQYMESNKIPLFQTTNQFSTSIKSMTSPWTISRCVKYGITSHRHPGNPFGKTSAFVKKNELRDCIQDLPEVSAVLLLRGSWCISHDLRYKILIYL